ncbi:MAG: DUF1501 domain-containing protein [Candidatus Omnitrophica bacterium]|nr:DUF1501 domain-containing protein [Candidatus Omnitrophota bacterium]
MDRRTFLKTMLFTPLIALFPNMLFALATRPDWKNLLVLVELKGGNDGLNTIIPFRDPLYYQLRPQLAIRRDRVLKIDSNIGFHPSLQALLPAWKSNDLAIVQGVGYPDPNLSHFRSIEIWETGSDSEDLESEGWLSRLFSENPTPKTYTADGVVIGDQALGPLSGGHARALVLPGGQRRMRKTTMEDRHHQTRPNASLMHILKVEGDYIQASEKMFQAPPLRTTFPGSGFGRTVERAAKVVASDNKVAVIKLSIGGFDTHAGQLNPHTRILKDLGDGLAALRKALIELGRWDSTLIMTYSEFGRRPKENMSTGTDHGTASVQLMLGGRVKGGLYGEYPNLGRLVNGNLRHTVDFRSMYATVIDEWWGADAYDVFGQRFAKLPILRR